MSDYTDGYDDGYNEAMEDAAEDYERGFANGYDKAIAEIIPTDPPSEVVIRKWGDIWHMRSDGSSSTSGDYLGALAWAASDLETGGPGVLIRIGSPVAKGDRP